MTFASRTLSAARLSLGLLALGMASATGIAETSSHHIAPGILSQGKSMGLENPSTKLNLTVWLNPHNQAELDARVQDLYTPGSKTYHQWLKNADLKAYMPTAAEVASVQKEIEAHNLKITYLDPMGGFIRFTGQVSDVESAFGTRISKYSVKGNVVHTTSSVPRLSGAAGALVKSLSGVNSVRPSAYLKRPIDPKTQKAFPGIKVTKNSKVSNGEFFASDCFYAPTTISMSGVNADDGTTPVSETVTGLTYGANPANTAKGQLPACGYSASQVQGFYGLGTAYKRGYTGKGQSIIVIDEGTNAQALTDGNVFNSIEGLPAFTSSNYTEYNPFHVAAPAYDYGSDAESDLDVEWAHAAAPGAKIGIFDIAGDLEDFQAAVYYIVENDLANVVSISYGEPEFFTGDLDMTAFNYVYEIAASKGVSVQVSTGDDGDFTVDGIAADVNGFGSSPYDTAVGGTSISTAPASKDVYTVGWGNNTGFFSFGTGSLVDPPTEYTNFYGGSGGGASGFFAKPSYQASLPGTKRLLPDVSALADPFTGAEFVYDDEAGNTYVGAVGGTSLAAPLFSGMWAIIDQYAGGTLGLAAPYIAFTPYPLLTDVLPLNGPDNVTASVTDPKGTTSYSAVELAGPLHNTTDFVSAIWEAHTGGYNYYVTFGTDSSLTVTQGWDNVTGWGTPNMGLIFSVLP